MQKGFARRLEISGSDISFYTEPFTPISLTGANCALACKHCNKHYLRHMLDGSSGRLYEEGKHLESCGAKGILLSGGSAFDGSVPTYLKEDEIRRIKNDTSLKISAHTGIVDRHQAEKLSHYLDMALVDVIGADETIRDILGLTASVQDYEKSLDYLSSAGIPLAPHIIVGLHHGKLKGELRALEMVKKFRPEVVVIVVFIPTKGTSMENTPPPRVEDVVRVIAKAREMFDVPISLSCVRPGGRYRSILDKYAVLSGIDRIVIPSRNDYKVCEELGLNVIEVQKLCCSYI